MDYTEVLSRSWRIVWNNKWLWILGFLVALGGGGGGGGNTNFNFNGQDFANFTAEDGSFLFENVETPGGVLEIAGELLAPFVPLIVGGIVLLLVLGIIFWVVSLIARAGLITAVADLNAERPADFGSAWRNGRRHWLRLAGFQIVLALPVAIIVILSVGSTVAFLVGQFSQLTGGGGDFELFAGGFATVLLCLVPVICLAVVLSFILQFIGAFGYRGIALEGMSIVEGFRHGWSVFRKRVVEWLLLAILYGVIGFVYSFIVAFVVGLLALAGIAPLIFGAILTETAITAAQIGIAVIVGIVAALVGAALLSIMVAWRSAGFTLAYLDATKPETPEEKAPDEIDPFEGGFDAYPPKPAT